MSMLAAPRRKQKVINLRAKNNAWSNDTNKFGQRMLEKMGWSSGKGLGVKENGMVEHVVARYKNDEKGLGYEDKNDQWMKHEDDFNALLANLSNGDVKEEKLHSGVSLEDKSKKSKARVHYHKFTRGKDLTKYSEKDLANIFGKRTLKNEENTPEKSTQAVERKEKIFTDKGSMEDYFKSKIAALKSKNQMSLRSNVSNDDTEVDYVFRGFSETTDDSKHVEKNDTDSFSFYCLQKTKTNSRDEIAPAENLDCDSLKKKKKKKKDKYQLDIIFEGCNSDDTSVDKQNLEKIPQEEPRSKKKNYKKENETNCESTGNIKKSKKKKHAEITSELQSESVDVVKSLETQCEDYHVPKKKKKRKNNKL